MDETGSNETSRRETMERIARSLIEQMGGEVVKPGLKFSASHWIYYKRLEKRDFPRERPAMVLPPKYTRVHWLFITESYFAYGRRDISKYTLNLNS